MVTERTELTGSGLRFHLPSPGQSQQGGGGGHAQKPWSCLSIPADPSPHPAPAGPPETMPKPVASSRHKRGNRGIHAQREAELSLVYYRWRAWSRFRHAPVAHASGAGLFSQTGGEFFLLGVADKGRSHQPGGQTSSRVPPLGRLKRRPFISGGGAAPSEGPEVGRAKVAGRFLPEVESG